MARDAAIAYGGAGGFGYWPSSTPPGTKRTNLAVAVSYSPARRAVPTATFRTCR
jgi:hypothetical protein